MDFPEYDPNDDGINPCNFLVLSLGETSFESIKTHLETCENCRREVAHSYFFYRNNHDQLYADYPEGLGIEDFLQTEHLILLRKRELGEHVVENLRRRLPKNIKTLSRWFETMHRLLHFKSFNVDNIVDKEFAQLIKRYKELITELGEHEFHFLLGFENAAQYGQSPQEQVEEIFENWRKVLGLEKEDEN